MHKPKVLVIGDVMLDVYKHCEGVRISPEAPAIIGRLLRTTHSPGGAANVATNLSSLGAEVELIGACRDKQDELTNCLPAKLRDKTFFVRSDGFDLIRKTRYLIDNKQIFREDQEPDTIPNYFYSDGYTQQLGGMIEYRIERFKPDYVVMSDYNKGTLTNWDIVQGILRRFPTFVDTKNPEVSLYSNAYCLKINEKEARRALDLAELGYDESLLTTNFNIKNLVITRGSRGITWIPHKRYGINSTHFPAVKRGNIIDVTGAGDTVLAALVFMQGVLATPPKNDEPPFRSAAVDFAATAAGFAVSEPGTTAVMGPEVLAAWKGWAGKVFGTTAWSGFEDLADCWRTRGHKIVMTNGCFDILHPGHMELLQTCARHGDKVVVAINSDTSIKALKGDARPIMSELDRARMLAMLSHVDAVITFDSISPLDVVKHVRPDVLVKGSDYLPENIIGAAFVKSYGGQLIIHPLLPNHSTTRLIDRIATPSSHMPPSPDMS